MHRARDAVMAGSEGQDEIAQGCSRGGGGSGWLGGGKRSFLEDFQIICVEEGLLEGCGGIQTIWLGDTTRLGGNNGCGRV